MILVYRLLATAVLIGLIILFNGEPLPVAVGFILYVVAMYSLGRSRKRSGGGGRQASQIRYPEQPLHRASPASQPAVRIPSEDSMKIEGSAFPKLEIANYMAKTESLMGEFVADWKLASEVPGLDQMLDDTQRLYERALPRLQQLTKIEPPAAAQPIHSKMVQLFSYYADGLKKFLDGDAEGGLGCIVIASGLVVELGDMMKRTWE